MGTAVLFLCWGINIHLSLCQQLLAHQEKYNNKLSNLVKSPPSGSSLSACQHVQPNCCQSAALAIGGAHCHLPA